MFEFMVLQIANLELSATILMSSADQQRENFFQIEIATGLDHLTIYLVEFLIDLRRDRTLYM